MLSLEFLANEAAAQSPSTQLQQLKNETASVSPTKFLENEHPTLYFSDSVFALSIGMFNCFAQPCLASPCVSTSMTRQASLNSLVILAVSFPRHMYNLKSHLPVVRMN